MVCTALQVQLQMHGSRGAGRLVGWMLVMAERGPLCHIERAVPGWNVDIKACIFISIDAIFFFI